MMFKNIDEGLNWLIHRRAEKHDFAAFKKLMAFLGNPQDDFKTIHVAGTNGKGSTVTYLRDLLLYHGYKVGTLQSPHYLTHLDRIRINGDNIPEDVFLRLLNKYYELFVEYDLNMFEMDFIIMCFYFKEANVDYAIIETGIGGRLDSTNVLNNPLLAIIVSIGYDHMDRLGNTLDLILLEKLGIVKENRPLLIGQLAEDLKAECLSYCKDKGSSLYCIKPYTKKSMGEFIYDGHLYHLRSLADYQLHNAALALTAFDILAALEKINKDVDKCIKAINSSLWPGRFELICEKPNIILDGAHNIDGIKALCASIDNLKGSKAVLFAALKTKEYQKMIALIRQHVDALILTSFDYPLACGKDDYQSADYRQNYREALEELKGQYDNIIIAGSLYFLSDFMQEINK